MASSVHSYKSRFCINTECMSKMTGCWYYHKHCLLLSESYAFFLIYLLVVVISLLFYKAQKVIIRTVLPVFPSYRLHLWWPIQGEYSCEYPSDKGKQNNVLSSSTGFHHSIAQPHTTTFRLSEAALQFFDHCGFTHQYVLKYPWWDLGSTWNGWMGRRETPVWRGSLVGVMCSCYRDIWFGFC